MKSRQQIEARALEIAERVVSGGKVEDDFVECKAEWVHDTAKAARRIAGLANAARGEGVMWLIGLDENNHQVVPLDSTDPANWWGSVESKFADGVVPSVRTLSVPTAHGLLMCLYFETDRSPYVVTANGVAGVTREVPWREGTLLRTAKRHELLSLLSAAVAAPKLELLQPKLTLRLAQSRDRAGDPQYIEGQRVLALQAELFIDSEARALLPRHRWRIEFVTDGDHRFVADTVDFTSHLIWDDTRKAMSPELEHVYGVAVRRAGLAVSGPDSVALSATAPVPIDVETYTLRGAGWIDVILQLPTNGVGRVATARQRLGWSSGDNDVKRRGHTTQPIFAEWAIPMFER
ncbi:hypothetical protein [Nocardia sp. bgisy134]|uniref:hypothetical protein n=1 Tax=Nocardia sp. bgisy134 TaxID=3413789 RepID=UPI003D759680